MEFFLGVVSSLVASAIIIIGSRISLRWPYPRGIRFMETDRDKYIKEIASHIRNNKARFFFKGFTGFDLFSSEVIKRAFEETRFDVWNTLIFAFTDPASNAFMSEPNKDYTQDRLHRLQGTVIDFVRNSIFPNSTVQQAQPRRGVYFFVEDKNFFNLLVLDEVAFLFLRGFTEKKGPAGQLILKVSLSKCPALAKELIEFVVDYYIAKCQTGLVSGGA